MYNLEDDLGKVKSIKLSNGVEVIASLLSITDDYLNLGEPRVVVINDDELALIPYIFTGSSEEVVVGRRGTQKELYVVVQPHSSALCRGTSVRRLARVPQSHRACPLYDLLHAQARQSAVTSVSHSKILFRSPYSPTAAGS